MSSLSFGPVQVVFQGPGAVSRELMLWARNFALDAYGRRVYKVEIDPGRNIIKVYRTRLFRGPACHYHEI